MSITGKENWFKCFTEKRTVYYYYWFPYLGTAKMVHILGNDIVAIVWTFSATIRVTVYIFIAHFILNNTKYFVQLVKRSPLLYCEWNLNFIELVDIYSKKKKKKDAVFHNWPWKEE